MFKRVFVALVFLFLLPNTALAQVSQISEVVIEGHRRVELSVIKSVLSIKSDQAVSLEDIDRDIRAIYKLGHFEDVSASIEDRSGAKILIYRLAERPLVRKIKFSGNKELKPEKLRSLVSIETPGIYNPRNLNKSVEAIRKAYKQEGYHAAEIEAKVDISDNNEATITFEIKEGEKVFVRHIRFEGNTVFSDRRLKKFMETKEKWFLSWLTGRGTYNEEVIQNDLEIIADQYYNKGYVQVKIKQPLTTLTEEKKYMDLLIEIEEGDQFRLGKLDAQGDLIKGKEEILALVELKEGDIFSREQLRTSVFAINDLYADQGYAYVNVSPLTHLDTEQRKVNLTFEIEEGVQVTVDQIRITGNTKTRDKVIRREMKLVEGDLYSSTKMKESRRKIKNLGFFEEVSIATSKGIDESHMDVNVDVKERPTGTFSVGFGYSSMDGFLAQGSVTQDNFLGRALKLSLAGSFGGESTTYQLGILEPYFLDRNLALGFDLYNTDREWTDFSKKTKGGDIKTGFPITDNTRAFFIYRYEEKEIYDVDFTASNIIREQEGTSTLSSIYASLTRNTTDYYLDPTKGSVTEGSAEFAGLGGTEKFSKYIVDYRHFFPCKWGTVFSMHGQLGYVHKTSDEDIPIDERFFLGGINTLRGFGSREVGPRDAATEDFIGGDKEAFFNFEYSFPLVKEAGLKGLFFFDTGNAWGTNESFFSDMRYSVGAGIRWFSPMGPMRLEWGYNLDPRDYEDNSQFEFSIGKFF
jgi:outer membrane protein insertion porin family